MSTKVQYYTAATLDGFIADEHHSLDWLFEVPHSDEEEGASSWDTFIAGVGVLTMGATTYEWVLEHHPEMRTSPDRWHEFYDDRPAWVFTHRELPPIPGVDIRFVQGPVRAAYDEMVAAVPDRNVWIVGDLQWISTTPASSTRSTCTSPRSCWVPARRCCPGGSPRRGCRSARAAWSVSGSTSCST